MYLKDILEDILPTKWSRYIAGLTIATSIAVLPLPHFWPLSTLVKTDTEVQIFQALLSVLTLLTGTLACLSVVVLAFHEQVKGYKAEMEDQRKQFKTTQQQTIENEITNTKKRYQDEIDKLRTTNLNLQKQITDQANESQNDIPDKEWEPLDPEAGY